MIEKKSVEGLLYEACRENRESLISYGPDFGKIESGALARLKKLQRTRRRRVWVRASACAAAVFVLMNVLIYFFDFAPAKAYRAGLRSLFVNVSNDPDSFEMQVVNTSKQIKEAQKSVPFQIPFPHWLPDGYALDNVRVTTDGSDSYNVNINYTSPTGQNQDQLLIRFSNQSDFNGTVPSEGEPPYEKHTLSGYDVYVMIVDNKAGQRLKGIYVNNQNLLIQISGAIDMQTLSRLIDGMKP